MLTLSQIPESLELLYTDYLEKSQLFFARLTTGAKIKHLGGTDIFMAQNCGDIFFLEDGYCKLYQDNKIIRLYNSSEFIVSSAGSGSFQAICDFAVRGFSWTKAEFESLLKEEALFSDWFSLREMENCINLHLAGVYLGDDVKLDFKHKSYKKGDLIIQSGEEPEMIFEMVSGEAFVMADNKELGKIYEEEIFGEISFLTESTRTADVIAGEDCTVRMLDMATFEKLITIKPRMILSISKTLAERIVHLNNKLVSI